MRNTNETSGELEPNTLVLEDQSLQYGFIQIPKQILYARNISRDAKFLYAILLGYAWQEQRCFPGYRRLCHDMQASENMVRKYMRELEAVGLLRQKRRGLGKTNLYTLPDLRTAKIEVLEPQFSHAPDPAKTEGKLETVEKETDEYRSKFERSPGQEKRGDERRTTEDSSSLLVVPQPESASELPARPALMPLGEILRLRQQAAVAIGDGPAHQAASGPQTAPAPPRRKGRPPGSGEEREELAAYLGDFARELGDAAPLSSTITRVVTLFQTAGVPRERWGDTLYQARAITQERTAQIRTLAADGGTSIRRKNKMPYFLAVLEDLLGLGTPDPLPS